MPAQTVPNSSATSPNTTVSYEITDGPSLRQIVVAMRDLHCGELPRWHRFVLKAEPHLLSLPNEVLVEEIFAHDDGRFKIRVAFVGVIIATVLYAPKSRTGSLSFV